MASIRDVANLSGVSTATVSHVLNGRNDRVGSETSERVLAAVRQLGYRPTALEDRQKAILSRNIAIMTTDLTKRPLLTSGYFAGVLDGVLESAMLRGWSVTIFVENMWGDVGLAARRSYDGRCDGLIMVAPASDCEIVPVMRDRGSPLVLVGTTADSPGVSSVDADNVAIGGHAAKHLLALGHRSFAFAGKIDVIRSSIEREQGFREALFAAGIPESSYVSLTCDRKEQNDILATQFMSIPVAQRPTAILCWHDGLAARFSAWAQGEGIRVPEDLSIIGVNDGPECLESEPRLSTFHQNLPVLGRRAATLLIDRIEDPNLPDEVVRFQPKLIIRESTASREIEDLHPDSSFFQSTNGGYP
jgi:DNA-binding LacI/PurR family transcriptional regulator